MAPAKARGSTKATCLQTSLGSTSANLHCSTSPNLQEHQKSLASGFTSSDGKSGLCITSKKAGVQHLKGSTPPLEPEGRGKERIREENTGTLLKENFEKGKRIKKWKEF